MQHLQHRSQQSRVRSYNPYLPLRQLDLDGAIVSQNRHLQQIGTTSPFCALFLRKVIFAQALVASLNSFTDIPGISFTCTKIAAYALGRHAHSVMGPAGLLLAALGIAAVGGAWLFLPLSILMFSAIAVVVEPETAFTAVGATGAPTSIAGDVANGPVP